MTPPLRHSFTVECPLERAFDTWTRRTSLWWPAGHTVTGEPGLEIVLEPRVGGRIFERTPSGREEEWGQILSWDPPDRLAYLWYLRVDRADATEVEIAFKAEPGDRTRVEIEHRGWERLGSRAPERRKLNRRGWDGLLPHYVEACSTVERGTLQWPT